MTDDRLATAMGRLDRALARVERAADGGKPATSHDLAQLSARHDRLRSRTQEAIGALDRLIEAN